MKPASRSGLKSKHASATSSEPLVTRVIHLSPILIPTFFFVGYLHKYVFYILFGLDISDYITLDEVVILSLSELATSFPLLCIIVAGTVAFLLFIDYSMDKLRALKPNFMYLVFLSGIHVTALALFTGVCWFILRAENASKDDLNAYEMFLRIVCVLWFMYLMWKLNNSSESKILTRNDLIISFVVILMFANSVLQAHLKFNKIVAADKVATTLTQLKDANFVLSRDGAPLDSIIFIGQTRNFLFYRHRNKSLTLAIDKGNISAFSHSKHDTVTVKTILRSDPSD